MDMKDAGLELIRDLHNADDDLVRIAITVDKIEFYHRIIFSKVILDIGDLVVQQVSLDVCAEDLQGVCKIDLQRAGVIGSGLHAYGFYHRINAEAHVKPLPNAARQIKSFSLILPSAQASLIAIGIDAAVVFP